MFRYSNGWGHLIATLVFVLTGTVLMLFPNADPSAKGIGVWLVTTAAGAWLIPGAAKQVVIEVTKHMQIIAPPSSQSSSTTTSTTTTNLTENS